MSVPSVTTPEPGTAERMAYLTARPVVSAQELAELGGVSPSTVRRAIDAGELPATKIGRRVVIPTAAGLAWLGIDTAIDTAIDAGKLVPTAAGLGIDTAPGGDAA